MGDDAGKYRVDGLTPSEVRRVTTVAELSATLSEAHTAGSAVIPWGGGTRMHIGNIPTRYDIGLDLSGLSSGIVHESGDLTVVADAGVTVERLNAVLEKQGQRLPFDVAKPAQATIGGSVASNAPGRMRTSLGGIRDWIIGISVVLTDGTVTKSGGRVVKNVQGYDLHRLHTGAFGTLGVVSEVALKVAPMPKRSSAIATWFGTIEDAGEFTMQVFNGPAQPESLTLYAGARAEAIMKKLGSGGEVTGEAVVMARITGGDRAVERMESDLTGLAGTTGASGYEVLDSAAVTAHEAGESNPEPTDAAIRATFKPGDAIKFISSVISSPGGAGLSAELQTGFGSVEVLVPGAVKEQIDRLTRRATEFGVSTVVERCPLALKTELDVFGDPGPEQAVMNSVKSRFDPGAILNPGRFAGRL